MTKGVRPASRRHGGEPGHRVNEAGLAVGRYQESWLTYYPLARDAAVDAVADLNDASPKTPAGRCSRHGE
jgi:hypothetical protein